MTENYLEQGLPTSPQPDGTPAQYIVPLAGNEGRQTPLFVNATTGPNGVRIFITGGDFSFRNIVGEERYARHLELINPSSLAPSLFQRFLGKIGLQ